MADYNTFNLCDCKTGKSILISSSIRKCLKMFCKGKRIDVWNGNNLVEKIYYKNIENSNKYKKIEKEYISEKQKIAHQKKERRRARALERESARKCQTSKT